MALKNGPKFHAEGGAAFVLSPKLSVWSSCLRDLLSKAGRGRSLDRGNHRSLKINSVSDGGRLGEHCGLPSLLPSFKQGRGSFSGSELAGFIILNLFPMFS